MLLTSRAGARDLARVDVGVHAQDVAALADRHHDFLHDGVARALADAVDRALDLPRARLHARERVGGRHAEVVVAVHRDDRVLDAAHVLAETGDERAELLGIGVAGGVGDVDDGRARGDDRLDHAVEVGRHGSGGVLGVELDVLDEGSGELDRRDGALDRLVLADAQLVAQVRLRDADAGVDARAGGGLERGGGGLDVVGDGARQAADDGGVAHLGADALHALEVAGARDREAGLDDVDAQAHELAGDLELLLGVHGGARRLLAVAQGGVEDEDAVGGVRGGVLGSAHGVLLGLRCEYGTARAGGHRQTTGAGWISRASGASM